MAYDMPAESSAGSLGGIQTAETTNQRERAV